MSPLVFCVAVGVTAKLTNTIQKRNTFCGTPFWMVRARKMRRNERGRTRDSRALVSCVSVCAGTGGDPASRLQRESRRPSCCFEALLRSLCAPRRALLGWSLTLALCSAFVVVVFFFLLCRFGLSASREATANMLACLLVLCGFKCSRRSLPLSLCWCSCVRSPLALQCSGDVSGPASFP